MGVDKMASQEQLALVAECRASDMTAKDWCEARGINYRHYVYWASRVNGAQRTNQDHHDQQQPQPQWAPVKMTGEPEVIGEIRLVCGRWTICVGTGFSPVLLAEVLKVVDGIC